MNNTLVTVEFGATPAEGRPVFRELAPAEHGLLQEHILRLSPESRLMRFGCPTSDYMLDRYCANQNQPTPVMCGVFIDGTLRGVIELRFGGNLPENSAEIGISVEDAWRSRGFGAKLMALAFEIAKERGLTLLEMNFVPHNGPVRRLARRFGGALSNQMGLVRARFTLGADAVAPIAAPVAA